MSKFSQSNDIKAFEEFLQLFEVQNKSGKYIQAIDLICVRIKNRFTPAIRGKSAYICLKEFAHSMSSLNQFRTAIKPVTSGSDIISETIMNEAIAYYYYRFASGRSNEEVFAEYMAGRYRLGYGYLAQYLACSLFEKIINTKFESQLDWHRSRRTDINRIPLKDKIECLTPETLREDSLFTRKGVFEKYIYKVRETGELQLRGFSDFDENCPDPDENRLNKVKFRLHNFRYLRNSIIHGDVAPFEDEMPHNRDEFIYYVWSELAPKSFELALKHWAKTPEKTIKETLWEISADYMTRAVDETMASEDHKGYGGLEVKDFENLYELRRKLALLKNDLDGWLAKKHPSLMTDILTTIDTTSAYIWMPFVPAHFKKKHSRDGIFNCCVSILATPLDIRIYMDFGGYAQEQRFKYYQFLESSYYKNAKKALDGHGITIFDIDWFSALHNSISLESLSEQQRKDRIDLAKEKLLNSRRPVTWNRMLHGFVIPAEGMASNDKLNLDIIKQHLQTIITFHEAFERFEPPEMFIDYKKRHGKEDDDD